MTRTTLDLDPAVLGELRARGARDGKPMGEVASELLATALKQETRDAATPFAWATGHLGAPTVDLADPEAVRRALG